MNPRQKVMISIVKYGCENGYDVKINDENANIQDYLDALNEGIEKLSLTRARDNRNSCAGCDLCCSERAPLTWIDIVNLNMAFKGNKPNFDLQDFLATVGYIVIDGPVVDIMLRRGNDNKCVFLRRDEKLCSIYRFRPLVCQAFICAPSSRRASWIWELIVNKGEDELVRRWLSECRLKGREPIYDKGYNPSYRLSDWESTPFSGKNFYSEVMIKDLCPPKLWKLLRSNNH